MTTTPNTGTCRLCRVRVPLTPDGRCAPHGQWRPARRVAEIECDGTGRLPLIESDHTP